MKECLGRGKGGSATAKAAKMGDDPEATEAKPSQKGKMKACNAEAKSKGLKGDERKAFMGDCLKG